MGTSVEDAYVERLHEDIQIACNRLEEIGCDSLVIVVSGADRIKMGSKKGRNYLDDFTDFIEEFCHYCRDAEHDGGTNHAVVQTPNRGKTKKGIKTTPKRKKKTGKKAQAEKSEVDADDALVPEINDEDEGPGEDSDGDSVMSGLGESDSEENSNKKTKVIVVKAEPLGGVEGRMMISASNITLGDEDVDQDSNTWLIDEMASADDETLQDVQNSKGSRKKTRSTKTPKKQKLPENRTFPCNLCEKVYKRMEDLKIHCRKHDGVFPFTCMVCQKGFLSNKMLRAHEPVHSASKPYPCDQCLKQYTRKEDLIIHKRKHSGETPYKCEICIAGFIGRKQLKNHKAALHGEKPHKCTYCDKEYVRFEDLRSHQNQHTGDKPYTCTLCDERFPARWQLRDHKKNHFHQEYHMCETCGKSFSRKQNLERHKILHTGNIVGKCEICEKEFRDKSTLKKHQFRHSGEKPFTCEKCAKQFWSKYLLTAHVRLHTGEKPYECDLCGLKFVLKRYLTRHRLRAHKDTTSSDLEVHKTEEDLESVPIHHLGRVHRNLVAGSTGIGYTAARNTVLQTHKDADGNTVLMGVLRTEGDVEGDTSERPTVQKDTGTNTEQEVSKIGDELEGGDYLEVKDVGGYQEMILQAGGLEEILKRAGGEVTIVLKE